MTEPEKKRTWNSNANAAVITVGLPAVSGVGRPGWQGRGVGRLLLDKLTRYLHGRGTAEIVGECLPENRAMAALARHAGYEVSTGRDAVTMRLSLR